MTLINLAIHLSFEMLTHTHIHIPFKYGVV